MPFTLHDLDTMARTIYGEARGELEQGRLAVGHVIRNRSLKRRKSIAAVCLQPWQFSCWNAADPNRAKLQAVALDDPVLLRCLSAAVAVMQRTTDPTQGATHYHTRQVSPRWAQGHTPCYTIGAHLFYNDVR